MAEFLGSANGSAKVAPAEDEERESSSASADLPEEASTSFPCSWCGGVSSFIWQGHTGAVKAMLLLDGRLNEASA